MTTTLTFTSGSGTVGDIKPGWSVSEQATPVAPGQPSAGTGQVSMEVAYGTNSEFVIDNGTSFSHTSLGTITGKVDTLQPNGETDALSSGLSLTTSTGLTLLNSNAYIPPCDIGTVRGVASLALHRLGLLTYTNTVSTGYFYPMIGTTSDTGGTRSALTTLGTPSVTAVSGSVPGIVTTAGGGDSNYGNPSGFAIGPGQGVVMQYLVNWTAGTDYRVYLGAGAGPYSPGYERQMQWALSGSANTIAAIGSTGAGTSTTSVAAILNGNPIMITVYVTQAALTIYATNSAGTSVNATSATYNTSYSGPLYVAASASATGGVTPPVLTVYGSKEFQTITTPTLTYWTREATFIASSSTHDSDVALAPGYNGNVWKYLNDLCAAFDVEISSLSNVTTLRDTRTFEINSQDVIAGSASLSLDTTATGRSIDVVNYRTTAGSGTMYDAATDGRIFTVDAGETITETVTTKNFPLALGPLAQSDTFPIVAGQYYVVGSDNLPVVASQWAFYGGSVTATISQDVPGGIVIKMVGPNAAIPGVPAPYSLAVSDGNTSYPALIIAGTGVFTDPTTVNILTGADEAKTTEPVAQTIDNIFLANLALVYDRGVWAATLASGPVQTLRLSVPTSSLVGFGTVAGGLVRIKNSVYRVMDVDYGNAESSLTMVPHVTTGNIDTIWASDTTGTWDAYWGSNETIDFKVKPTLHP